MSKKGENIYKRKDGRWEARFVRERSLDGSIHYGYCYGKSYKEVKEKVSVKKSLLINDVENASKKSSEKFSRYCWEWLFLINHKVKESTYVKYVTAVNNHILPLLGKLPLGELSSVVIEKFSRELSDVKGLSSKTVKDILVVLQAILNYTSKNYFGMPIIEISYPKEQKKEMRVLSTKEQRIFTNYLLQNPDVYKIGILIALTTGLRIGEICALKWKDVSFENMTIKVSQTMQRLKNLDENSNSKTRIVISEPKSDNSARIIPLTDFTADIFKLLDKENRSEFVLSGRDNKFVEPRVLQYRLGKYTKECGLEGVHFHTLRHSFATRCVEVGFELKSLSEILGHSNPTITMQRYVHSSLELKRNNMNKLSLIGY